LYFPVDGFSMLFNAFLKCNIIYELYYKVVFSTGLLRVELNASLFILLFLILITTSTQFSGNSLNNLTT